MDRPTALTRTTPPEADRSAPRGFVLRLGLANLGLYSALLTPVVVTMALRVAEVAPQHKESTLGLVLGIGAVLAMVANPLFGRLSDRTRSRFGRRRPWLVGGVVGGALGLCMIAFLPSVPALVIGWAITQCSFNAAFSALMASIPDQVPESGLGRASGAIGTSLTGAVLVGSGIAAFTSDLRVMLLLPAVLAVGLVCWFAATLPDRTPAGAPQPFSVREFLGSFVFDPRRAPDFGWAWFTKFLVMFGSVAPMTYLAYYVPFRMGLDAAATAGLVAALVAGGYGLQAATAALGGWLSDRTGRRKPFVMVSGLIVAIGIGLLAAAPGLSAIVVAQLVISVGGGLFYAVDTALITHVLPDESSRAKDLGIVNIANALPQSLMPMIAPFVLAVGGGQNYPLLFGIAAAATLLGALLVTRIKGTR
ncbi:MFS transporter [Saccharopolyspora sp. NPDC002686]|uniref:MFS transporter n=1 Tax=Saccharopolyspora sp. NPDC002686 TaxID=3154541 RepID=UPI003330E890